MVLAALVSLGFFIWAEIEAIHKVQRRGRGALGVETIHVISNGTDRRH